DIRKWDAGSFPQSIVRVGGSSSAMAASSASPASDGEAAPVSGSIVMEMVPPVKMSEITPISARAEHEVDRRESEDLGGIRERAIPIRRPRRLAELVAVLAERGRADRERQRGGGHSLAD